MPEQPIVRDAVRPALRYEDVQREFLRAFSGRLGSHFDAIDTELTPDEIGLDSMALIKLLLSLERGMGVQFDDKVLEELSSARTIGELYEKIIVTYVEVG